MNKIKNVLNALLLAALLGTSGAPATSFTPQTPNAKAAVYATLCLVGGIALQGGFDEVAERSSTRGPEAVKLSVLKKLEAFFAGVCNLKKNILRKKTEIRMAFEKTAPTRSISGSYQKTAWEHLKTTGNIARSNPLIVLGLAAAITTSTFGRQRWIAQSKITEADSAALQAKAEQEAAALRTAQAGVPGAWTIAPVKVPVELTVPVEGEISDAKTDILPEAAPKVPLVFHAYPIPEIPYRRTKPPRVYPTAAVEAAAPPIDISQQLALPTVAEITTRAEYALEDKEASLVAQAKNFEDYQTMRKASDPDLDEDEFNAARRQAQEVRRMLQTAEKWVGLDANYETYKQDQSLFGRTSLSREDWAEWRLTSPEMSGADWLRSQGKAAPSTTPGFFARLGWR